MGKGLLPDRCEESAYTIDYRKMYSDGFRGIIYDIDNTLVLPDAPADRRAVELFKSLREIGFRTVILSNNTGERTRLFAEAVGSMYLTKARKPLPAKYLEAVRLMDLDSSETFFVGDQIYTDVWGANNAGLYCILTRPFTYKEEPQIVLKRFLEKPVLKRMGV